MEGKKKKAYQKNDKLDNSLNELDALLRLINLDSVELKSTPNYPTIFIVGSPRSGTTLLSQWLASTSLFSFPSNIISRFSSFPLVGYLVQKILLDPQNQYKNEISLINDSKKYSSDIGKTHGALEPHEFWYFWRKHFEFTDIPISNESFSKSADFKSFEKHIDLIKQHSDKPFFIKSLIINPYIESFYRNIKNAFFIYIKRDEVQTAKSILKVRERYFENDEEWFSFKPHEYKKLINKDKYVQVSGQVHYINKNISDQLLNVPEGNQLQISYSNLCEKPETIFQELVEKLNALGGNLNTDYQGLDSFDVKNTTSDVDALIEKHLASFKND